MADHVNHLLPTGLAQCPVWPPDLFAVMASLAERTGFYAEPTIVLSVQSGTNRGRILKRTWASLAAAVGEEWSRKGRLPQVVQELWRRFVLLSFCPLDERNTSRARAYKRLAARLLAIADEASRGIGFIPEIGNLVAQYAFLELIRARRRMATQLRVPSSICLWIDPDIACVMPKSLTPTVGCTLRSLSHHLALLPARGTVRARWYFSTRVPGEQQVEERTSDFNIVVIPFPYRISRKDFREARPPDLSANVDGYFTLNQGWLDKSNSGHPPEFAKFLVDIVEAAIEQAGCAVVHAIVLPETALNDTFADASFKLLRKKFPELEAFIVGVLSDGSPLPKNNARLYLPHASVWTDQSKHHRWMLNRRQIEQYQLSRTLDPTQTWWENIDVSNRRIGFALLRQDVVMCTLVCEDLARFDPVLPIVNSVGPNLVVALLMDGPQLQSRWPGRYATVLAEDPGSAVLSVTSLGMARLARRHGEAENRTIALWKDAGGGPARELYLPADAHALLLCLRSPSDRDGATIDGRRDGGATVSLELNEVWPIEARSPPAWLS